jgi:light-regulated signal transduction histidine kinase (bacteriophytochrome)
MSEPTIDVNEPINVLLVEDNPGDVRLVREILTGIPGTRFRLECVDRLSVAAQRLWEGGIDVLLLDLGLPDSQGLSTFTDIHARQRSVPVVVLSAAADEQLALEAVQAGAQDYLVKGHEKAQVLPRALLYAIERKRSEEQIHQLNAELLRRAIEAASQMEAANRELEEFAYGVSFDFKEPLQVMNHFAQKVLHDFAAQLSAGAQQELQMIQGRAQNLLTRLDGLFALSQVGRHPLEKVAVAPSDLVRQALEELRSEQKGRQIEIMVGELPVCQADPILLRQLFVNLLSNALKYTRHKAVARITVATRQPTANAIYYVGDNGAGFDMRYAERLFRVFQRLHPAEEFEGNGIGLAIARRIVQRHGGRIWAEGVVNEGATFYFTLAPSRP